MTSDAQKQARRRWRERRREAGLSFMCVIAEHDACHGRVGRLQRDERPPCRCPCHQQHDDEDDAA